MNYRKPTLFLILLNFFCNLAATKQLYDVTVIGYILFADGLGRLSIGFIDCLKNDLKINFIPTRKSNFAFVGEEVQKIVKNASSGYSKVSILFDALWYPTNCAAELVPDSLIKIAYSMFESTEIPEKWVELLNNKFDAVLVPDDWLIDVYKNSGVRIPIFVFPHGLYLEKFLEKKIEKNKTNEIFIFGTSLAFDGRKNHELLINAFCEEFVNEPNVKLKIHGRGGNKEILEKIKQIKTNKKNSNIEIICKIFNQEEYIDFISILHCFVSPSMGEGYAVPPREALALAKPVILTDAHAHRTICQTGFVEPVECNIEKSAYYHIFKNSYGNNFNCTIDDLKKALRNVYENYQFYCEKAQKGRDWVKQYLYSNLKTKYMALVKPKKVIFSNKNLIDGDGTIYTDSRDLFNKLNQL